MFSASPVKPTSLPRKYIDHEPVVVAPSIVGANSIMSLPWPIRLPLRPITENVPIVESRRWPFGSIWIASTSSELEDRPTSLPWKYIDHVPAVLLPSDEARKRRMSASLKLATPGREPGGEKETRVWLVDRQ